MDWLRPTSTRAKNRLKEHEEVTLVRVGIFDGRIAILTRCKEHCDWTGWFTSDEADWDIPKKNVEEI